MAKKNHPCLYLSNVCSCAVALKTPVRKERLHKSLKISSKQPFQITSLNPHKLYKIGVHRRGLVLVRTRVIVRGAPGIVVTFWKFNARALWNCTNGFLSETNFRRHLVWFNSWWSGSCEGRNWEASDTKGADYFLTILRIPRVCWMFSNAL